MLADWYHGQGVLAGFESVIKKGLRLAGAPVVQRSNLVHESQQDVAQAYRTLAKEIAYGQKTR